MADERGVNHADLRVMANIAVKFVDAAGWADSEVPKSVQRFGEEMQDRLPDFFQFAQQLGPGEFAEEMNQTHMLLRWLQSGLPVFEPTQSLLSSLLLTDPEAVNVEEVRQPFDTFAVRLPPKFMEVEVDAVQDEKRPLNPLVLTKPFRVPLSVLWVHSYDSSSSLALRLVAQNGAALWERLPAVDEVDTMAEWLILDPGKREQRNRYFMQVLPRDLHLQRAARRLYVNLCLYIAERGLGERRQNLRARGRVKRKKKKASRNKTDMNVWVLGREIKLDKNLIQASKAWVDAQRQERAQWRISKRFTVRGHWRMQACGPGRKERRRRWIEPHWRGPKTGTKLSHLYQMESER